MAPFAYEMSPDKNHSYPGSHIICKLLKFYTTDKP